MSIAVKPAIQHTYSMSTRGYLVTIELAEGVFIKNGYYAVSQKFLEKYLEKKKLKIVDIKTI